MTRLSRAAFGLPLAGLIAALVGANLSANAPSASAQTGPPPVEIHRVQDAAHTPPFTRDKPIFIAVLGSDARPKEEPTRQRADAIQLIGLNAKEGAGGILGFPRDSYVNVPGAGERRINEGLFYGGPKLQVRTIEELTGIKIDYYALTTFTGWRRIVREIGGIPIEIKYRMNDEASGTDFKPGRRKLGPVDALAFARDRKSAPGGDFGRSENQGRLLRAALAKLHDEFAEDPAVLLEWISAGMRNMYTNLSVIEVFDLATTAVQVDPSKITSKVVTGSNTMVGGAAVVQLSGDAQAVYDDLRDDGIFND
ncbi:MAG TPA: LCP family protein [Actinomycetota bacterium]|nr:LCP family protein [Actinomycetota bacterium]